MDIHQLKAWPHYFDLLWDQVKTYEIRFNDRDFTPGDVLWIRPWDPDQNEYGTRHLIFLVKSVITDHVGVADGFAALGIEEVYRIDRN